MSGTPTNMSAAHAAIVDADAVCEVCGNVNAEATLICRVCGNNLRDQKARRMAADVMLLEPERPSSRQFVRGGLVVLSLLVLAWTAINADNIVSAMIESDLQSDPLHDLFGAGQSAVYDQMLAEGPATVPTVEQVAAYIESPLVADSVDGNYVLVQDGGYGAEPIGTAVVRSDGLDVRFVATIGEGLQLRGVAHGQGRSAFRAAWNEAAGRDATGQVFAVSGVAVSQQDGSIECFGQSALDEASYEVLAFRLP